jgi:hypothetical protein
LAPPTAALATAPPETFATWTSPETTVETLMVELWMKMSSASKPCFRYNPASKAVNQTVLDASAEL